jgi:hypothetical protein
MKLTEEMAGMGFTLGEGVYRHCYRHGVLPIFVSTEHTLGRTIHPLTPWYAFRNIGDDIFQSERLLHANGVTRKFATPEAAMSAALKEWAPHEVTAGE